MILMIDNYDSFTYNLVQYLRMLSAEVHVARNDEITVAGVDRMAPSHIVISPGPGRPEGAGISLDLIRRASGRTPILGVCLGHQAIGQAFGGTIVAARRLMHGKTSAVTTGPVPIFEGIPSPFTAMRYHSLAVERKTLPNCLEICAEDEDGEIMGLRHRQHPTVGIQFHPESIMTPKGKRILKNFLQM
ncbi:MAG: aminodeoxychorismate/anthranilate synthase component II [Thermodesulfobacteriota bacterium]|nr:aminodeoxychorismate/anthranilate synthase component II [Thermodesulfobacteriota bacterium]